MLTKEDFMSKLKEARELAIIQRGLLEDIFGDYTFEHVLFEAQNSGNLEEAIQCYVKYDEEPVSGNIEEFWEVYSREVTALEEG